MVPLSIALIQRFFGVHERLGAWRIAGLGLGFIGVAALLGFGTISGPLGWAGVACMLIATLGYAIGPLIIQRHLGGLDPYGPLAASLGVASAVLLVPAILAFPTRMPSMLALTSRAILGARCSAYGCSRNAWGGAEFSPSCSFCSVHGWPPGRAARSTGSRAKQRLRRQVPCAARRRTFF